MNVVAEPVQLLGQCNTNTAVTGASVNFMFVYQVYLKFSHECCNSVAST